MGAFRGGARPQAARALSVVKIFYDCSYKACLRRELIYWVRCRWVHFLADDALARCQRIGGKFSSVLLYALFSLAEGLSFVVSPFLACVLWSCSIPEKQNVCRFDMKHQTTMYSQTKTVHVAKQGKA